jgi:hypothetical protein
VRLAERKTVPTATATARQDYMTSPRPGLKLRLDTERIKARAQINDFTLKTLVISGVEPDAVRSVICLQCKVARLSEDTMRIVMMGLLVGSALGVLAGTAVSAYVAPAMQVLQSYQSQANSSDVRSWDI